jgi:DNA primase
MLPPGEDPDSHVRTLGAAAFKDLIEKEKISFQDFQILSYRDDGYFASPDLKSKAIASMVKTIAPLPDPVQKELYLDELAKKLDISRQTLSQLMTSFSRTKSADSFRQRIATHQEGAPTPASEKPKELKPLSVTERTFLEALLESTFYGSEVLEFAASHEEMFTLSCPPAQDIFLHLVKRYREIQNSDHNFIDIAAEISSIEQPESRDLALDILFRLPARETSRALPYETLQHARRCLSHFLIAVKNLVMEPLQQEKQSVISQLPEASDKSIEKELFMRLNDLNKRIKSLDQKVSATINTILEG